MAENTNTERDASAILSKICDLFQIGKQARTESTIIMNVENVIHHARLLHAVERDLFPQPELPEDDDPYASVGDELPAPNSWAAKDEADYVAQFRAALASRASLSLPAAGQEPVANGAEDLYWRLHSMSKSFESRDVCYQEDVEGGAYATVLDAMNMARSLYAAPQPAVAAGWMPIETAPKHEKYRDGSNAYSEYIFAWYPGALAPLRVRWWQADSGINNFLADGGWAVFPTVWQPLPLPPAPSTEGERNG